MKATNSLSAPFALKLVGYILIFSSLLDYLFLLSGLDFANKQALGTGITQLVDRGVIPMIGLALALAGAWMEKMADIPAKTKLFRFIALVLAAVLGVAFLVLVPVHLNNTRQVAELAKKQIEEQAKNAEGQVEQQVQQRQSELAELVKDQKKFDEQLKQINDAITNKQVPEGQLPQIQQLQKDLQEIKADPSKLQTKAQDSRNQLLNQIRDQKTKQEQKINSEALKANLRTGLSSLILSVGYLIISWVGLSEMGLPSGSAKARRPGPAK
jgi:ABC-type multidrug transport system fused ATPase/permease subunit